MADFKPTLSDNEIHERITRAFEALGTEAGATLAGNAALEMARQVLMKSALAILIIQNKQADAEDDVRRKGEPTSE